jgi:hypothetical protein
VEYTGLIAVPDAVTVGFHPGIEPGVKPGSRLCTGIYADILGQIPAKLIQNLPARHVAYAVEIRHLTKRVRPGVGASTAADFNFLIQYSAKCLFQLALQGVVHPGQALPAPISGTIIADIKPNIPHIPPAPSVLPAHCQRKTGTYHWDHTLARVHAHIS